MMRITIYALSFLFLISCGKIQPINSDICLNGDAWTFTPIKIPFYGYELDSAGRWQTPQRSHQFIVDALNNTENEWSETPVRVPMSWSSAVSDPGETEVNGDFDFPYFWQYLHKGEYRRTFDIPKTYSDNRIKIDFSSINFACWVYINGDLIKAEGEDKPYTHLNKLPFTIDITNSVKVPSRNNELKIIVHDFSYAFKGEFPNEDNPNDGINYPLGDRCDYYNKDRGWRNIDNGLIGDVVLKAVPMINVDDIFIKTNVKQSTITAEITLWNQSGKNTEVNVGGFITDWKSDDKVFDLRSNKILSLHPDEKKTISLSERWENPQLWWPYDPQLFNFNITIDGRMVDHERFGFRQVEVVQSDDPVKRGFYLNGIKVRLMGESMEPSWKDTYSEGVSGSMVLYNPEYWSYVIDISKGLNINTLRTHRGMSLKRQFEIADEKGMMMIAESTINNGNHRGGVGTIENQRKAIRDLIKSHRNHPSIVFWSLANETPYQKEWELEAINYDDTRPLTATQLVPRNYPSDNIATAACAYSMGLNGYESEIYHRHDKYWKEKLLYIYEDNACYDEPLNYDRISTVQKGLSIFRGHRTSGYEMIFTFYTWQKLFGQPQVEIEKHMKIQWTQAQKQSCGYRPDYALMPLFDPWSNPDEPRIINPINGLKEEPMDFWRRSYSPVAVFDYEYDKRTDISALANPYIAPLSETRIIAIHNDDIQDKSTQINVKWQVLEFDVDNVISKGEFSIDVPLASVRKHELVINTGEKEAVRVVYQAYKSDEKRFEETIYLNKNIKKKNTIIVPEKMTNESLVINPTSKAVSYRGFSVKQQDEQTTYNLLVNSNPQIGDYVQFNPWITEEGNYDILLHIPEVADGIQKVFIQHDTHNTEMSLDFKKNGWVKLNSEPLKMQAGKLENSIRIIVSDTSQEISINALKITKL